MAAPVLAGPRQAGGYLVDLPSRYERTLPAGETASSRLGRAAGWRRWPVLVSAGSLPPITGLRLEPTDEVDQIVKHERALDGMQLLARTMAGCGLLAWPRGRDRFVNWLSFSNNAAVLQTECREFNPLNRHQQNLIE